MAAAPTPDGGDTSDHPADDTSTLTDLPTASDAVCADNGVDESTSSTAHPQRPHIPSDNPLPLTNIVSTEHVRSPPLTGESPLSPAAADRVFPIRSVVSVEPMQTPMFRNDKQDGYFHPAAQTRRMSLTAGNEYHRNHPSHQSTPAKGGQASGTDRRASPRNNDEASLSSRQTSISTSSESHFVAPSPSQPQQLFNDIIDNDDGSVTKSRGDASIPASERSASVRPASLRSTKSSVDDIGPLVTARFKHVVSEGGHAIITGRDGDVLQRCEDEPIHIPGAVQGFGLLVALEEQQEGKLVVRVVSENSRRLFGYTPQQLFALESFTDILTEEQADNLLDHVDFIREEDADVIANGPEVFTLSIRTPNRRSQKFWCAMHINDAHRNLIICEFEMEDDPMNPLVPTSDMTPEPPEDTLDSRPTDEEFAESTQNMSKPLRILRSARKRKGEAAAMEVFNIMSQVQEQLATAGNLEKFLKILVGVVKELTGFHRVMIYQFDHAWNGRVVTELVDPRATKDLYKGLNFPASDIPKQARDLYKINKVRMLYDRDQETARLVCRTVEDLETPLNLTHSYLRAMSPIHIKYLGNMAVRSSMSISINAFDELWGLIACHSYGSKGMRVSFPIRKMCRLVGDSASRNIERLSYASRLQARKLINTVPTQSNPSGYIIASSEDLLKLFDADFGLLSIRDETKIMGHLEHSQEALAMLEYLRMRSVTNVMTSQDIRVDFPDLRYAPGFTEIAGLLLVPLSAGGQDFIVFFRKGQLKEVKWAGNPYEKFIKEGTEGYLEPRKSFRTWSETVVGKCREWTEEEIETAAVLCLVYGKFIEVWRQKEAALQNSQLTRLLLANSAHEVRTPLNAIINYLEIALEGTLDQETRDNLAKSHSASKSLIYVINDLLDLTKTEEGGELVKDEVFDLRATLLEATDMFKGDAKRKNISYEIKDLPGLPKSVIGDQRRVRQAISNVTANAIQHTSEGAVKVEMYTALRDESRVHVEVSVSDTGVGMNDKKLDALFRELEQVQSEAPGMLGDPTVPESKRLPDGSNKKEDGRTLGLGLAVVARVIRNMNGQLRLKSEEGKGSRFVIQFPFDLPGTEPKQQALESSSSTGSATPHAERPSSPPGNPSDDGEMTLNLRSSPTRTTSYEKRTSMSISRKNSVESTGSKKSFGSMKSAHSNLSRASNLSGKSEADRLIEAIQEPHRVDGWHENSVQRSNSKNVSSTSLPRPKLTSRRTTSNVDTGGTPQLARSRSIEVAPVPEHLRETKLSIPGQSPVAGSGVPLRSIRMPEEFSASPATTPGRPVTAPSTGTDAGAKPTPIESPLNAENLRVLVAEDDPVNSRIIKKRLEKLEHEVCLTVNGEECASTYCEKTGFFDIVLMDMQMPIVDGLTSTKMIRSFEKSHPSQLLSTRASLNGRVPIIAVSASLVERERQKYIDGGFDGWILKPISFIRLTEIMEGIVDPQLRSDNIYKPGSWERGGWFDQAQKGVQAADTRPSEEPPVPLSTEMQAAVADVDPAIKEEDESVQSKEQTRLLHEQNETRGETGSPTNAVAPDDTAAASAEPTS